MQERKRVLAHGLASGLLAATAVVLWFLFIDLVQGRPLHTPGFLVGALLGLGRVEMGLGWIAAYTLLHYGAFAAVGIGAVLVLRRLERMPNLLFGAVLGFLLFDLMFYTSVVVTGVNVVDALGWPAVLAGNLLAGIVTTTYLRRKGETQGVGWLDVLREHRVLREGLVAGLLGASAVALWFLVFDVLSGRVFFTPAALGSAIFEGARAVAEVEVTARVVAAYSMLHMIVFLVAGLVAAAVAGELDEEAPLLLGAMLGFVTFETLFVGVVAIFASWILDTLGWVSIAGGNLIAAGSMGWYLLREHPALRKELLHLQEHSLEIPR